MIMVVRRNDEGAKTKCLRANLSIATWTRGEILDLHIRVCQVIGELDRIYPLGQRVGYLCKAAQHYVGLPPKRRWCLLRHECDSLAFLYAHILKIELAAPCICSMSRSYWMRGAPSPQH